ncbi:MAG: helix-turn-helix transcriptional regulator [Microscillaceae bacterium]|nr:helix-turn-helix transcriptional regulator [Microscillaceae bacterium]
MKEKNILCLLREQLGFTQQDLANYLGLSRSLVSLAESDQRQLPGEAVSQLQDLAQIFESSPPPARPALANPGTRLEEVQRLMNRLEKAYARWQSKGTQLMRREALLRQINASETRIQLWQSDQLDRAQFALQDHAQAPEALYPYQLIGLAAEEKALRNLQKARTKERKPGQIREE